MGFHRLTTPSYFGGLPGGYGMINTGAAIADGAKVGGPNAGTFFLAFGEDAVSKNFNRPVKALSENTDYLDDLLHRDLVVMHKTADVVAGGPTVTITLPVGTYLGGSGYTNTTESRARLFSVRDGNNRPILNVSYVETVVTGVVLTGGDAIGGGFSANTVTITLSPAIPTGITYRVYYGVRSNLAALETDVIPSSRDFALIYGHMLTPLGAHLATAISYAGGIAWSDGTTNPAATVEAQLDKIISDLTGSGGAAKVGYAGGHAWADASTNPAASIEAQFDKILIDLSDQGNPAGIGGSAGGAGKIGFNVQDDGGWLYDTVGSTYCMTVASALQEVDKAFRGIRAILNLHASGSLTVDGTSTLGAVDVSGVLSVLNGATLQGNVGATGAWHGDFSFDTGTVNFEDAAFSGNVYTGFLGTTGFQCATGLILGPLTLGTLGHIVYRQVISSSTAHSWSVSDGDEFIARGLAGSAIWAFVDTGAIKGRHVVVSNNDSTYSVLVNNGAGGALATLGPSACITLTHSGLTNGWMAIGH